MYKNKIKRRKSWKFIKIFLPLQLEKGKPDSTKKKIRK